MSSRSLNKVQLIGNLTRDPELRYTPQGTAVCTLGLATNRSWTTESGEKREETEFHRIVAWNKLAELCSQLLFKGRKVYVEGRLQTRTWAAQDGSQRQATEIVIEEMIILDSRQAEAEREMAPAATEPPVPETPPAEEPTAAEAPAPKKVKTKSGPKAETDELQEVDIPF
ncbi:MAG TPA: single-stranded DNA-binding protein [Patescibacteria group bacterium]|nr:single-stranded DNA-binding protein [Patescibacteria group bacterium]